MYLSFHRVVEMPLLIYIDNIDDVVSDTSKRYTYLSLMAGHGPGKSRLAGSCGSGAIEHHRCSLKGKDLKKGSW